MSEDPTNHADPHDTFAWRREITERQSATDKVVGEIRVAVGMMQQSIVDVANSVKQISQDQRFDRKPFQWSVVISFATLVLMVAGGYATLMMVPIRDQQTANTVELARLRDADLQTAHWQGIQEGRFEERTARLEAMQADIERVHANLDRTINGAAYSFGRQEAFEGRMDRISERIDLLHP
jgi:hypothetical protein